MISAVKDASQCRSLAKAKASCQDKELIAFKNALKELAVLNINPVTIPREWNIKHILNFLRAYFTEVMKEFSEFSNLFHKWRKTEPSCAKRELLFLPFSLTIISLFYKIVFVHVSSIN